MKKLILLFVTALTMMSAQIVNANPPKGHGLFLPEFRGKFEPVEFQKAMLLLLAEKQNDTKIAKYFNEIDGCSFSQMKEICRQWFEEAFDEEDITDAEMKKIINSLEFRFPEDDYWDNHSSMYIPNEGGGSLADMEWSHPKGIRKNEQIGSCKYAGKSVDLFTTYCGNATKEDKAPPVVKKKKIVEQEEDDYVFIPGKKKVIEYGADTVMISRSKVQIETNNNKFASFNNNQSYDVNTTSANFASNNQQQYQNNCSCLQQQNNVQSCGCTRTQLCEYHYNQLPQKEKKKFGQTVVGKVLKYALVYGTGVVTGLAIANNSGHSAPVGQVITQGPLDLLGNNTTSGVVYTQGQLWQ